MKMAGKFQAPVTPSLAELNAQALAGDDDALRLLVARSTTCETLTDLLERYVPVEEIAVVFDRFADAWAHSRTRALLDTLELPAVEQSNLNTGWKETS